MAVAQQSLDRLRTAGLAEVDPEIAGAARPGARAPAQPDRADRVRELHVAVRPRGGRLDVPTNKYAEGYPGQALLRRLRGRRRDRDARDRAREGALRRRPRERPAARRRAGEHGASTWRCSSPATRSSRSGSITAATSRTASRSTSRVGSTRSSTTACRARRTSSTTTRCCARQGAPAEADRLRRLGVPAHGRGGQFREIADEVGALLMCDMAHFAGLVAAGLHPNPVPHCDFVTSTTHKTLAGPRAGFILCREEHAQAVDRAVFPGMQGGPLMHTIAAKATCFRIAATEPFREYQQQVRANADALAESCTAAGSTCSRAAPTRTCCSSTCARTRVDGQGRRGAPARGQDHRQPQHGPVRRAAADRRLRRPRRHAGGDDARLRRGRLRARSAGSSCARARGRRRPPGAARRAARSSASGARSTRASAATRPTRADRLGVAEVDAPAGPAQARAAAGRRRRRRRCSASSSTS